jgi:hypothetical protein
LGVLRVSTSVAYLRKRLADIGRYDLLEACERGEVSTFACAEEAGLVTRREITGNGSPNQAKKRAWKLAQITRQSPLASKPENQPEPEISPKPASPKFSQDSRDIIARLVEAGRADLIIAVSERRISPFQAARIAERGDGRRRTLPSHSESSDRSIAPPSAPEPPAPSAPAAKSDEPATGTTQNQEGRRSVAPKPPALDVRALIG